MRSSHDAPGQPRPDDLLVVGGGLAGLTAAVVAARGGLRVRLLDGGPEVGGRARTDDLDGLLLNQGPHALYLDGAARRELRALGIDPDGAVPPLGGMGVFDGEISALPFGPATMVRSRLLGSRAKFGFARFQAGLSRLAADAAPGGSRHVELAHATVDQFLDGLTGHRDLRAMLAGVIRLSTYANAPERMSAGSAIQQLQLAMGGVRYLHQGWAALVAELAAAAEAAGVVSESRRRVGSVRPASGGGWSGGGWSVVIDGDGPEQARARIAPQVVLAGLAPEAVERIVDLPAGSLRAQVGPSVEAACLDLELAETPSTTFALDLDHHFYLSAHAPLAELAPAGRSLVSAAWYRPVDADEPANTDGDGPARDLEAFAVSMGAGPPLRRRYLHSMTVAHGVPLAERGGLGGRPPVDGLAVGSRLDGAGGLWLAGDWVGDEGFLADAAVASAVSAARRAVTAATSPSSTVAA
ncbi:MAG: NAD(P)-binding protein [Acidimicrobiales bacterium]